MKDELITDENNVYNSDAEDEKLRKLARSKISTNKTPTSNLAINNTKDTVVESNKKYLDISIFNKDRK